MIDYLTIPYRKFNEDKVIIKKNIVMVVDGATGLYDKNYMNDYSDATWLVDFIDGSLDGCRACNIIEKLYNISEEAFKVYINKSNGTLESMPSCGMAFAVSNDDYIDLYTIGDCEITYVTKNKEIFRMIDESLPNIDSHSLKEISSYSTLTKIPFKEAITKRIDILRDARKLANKENGYYIFTPSNNPKFKFLHYRVKVSEIDYIYLYSDGFAQAFTTLEISDHHTLFSENLKLEDITNKITKKWDLDKELTKYPRFKEKDDISIIKMTIKDE